MKIVNFINKIYQYILVFSLIENKYFNMLKTGLVILCQIDN